MSLEYLLLPRLQIQAANAQAAWWLINTAPVLAANLFAHNLGRKTGIFPEGVGIIHHHSQLLGERLGERFYGRLRPQQRRGAVFIDNDDYSSKNKYALSLQPTVTCHLHWSLLLAYDDARDIPSGNRIDAFLSGARLAGGQIIDHAKPMMLETKDAIRKAVRSGYWLIERSDLMATAEGDPLDVLIRASTQPKLRRNDDSGSEQDRTSWIVPATLGYAPITEFAHRGGVREGVPHAYAEPLVGLVQYVSVNQYTESAAPLWRHTWLEDVFVVTQKEI